MKLTFDLMFIYYYKSFITTLFIDLYKNIILQTTIEQRENECVLTVQAFNVLNER